MICNTVLYAKNASNARLKVIIFVLCPFLLAVLPSCQKGASRSKLPELSPPDLSGCTRVELLYTPRTLKYFFYNAERQDLLNPEEKEYLQSLKIVVDDPEFLKALAHDVSQGSYFGPKDGPMPITHTIHFVCYRNGGRLTSFTYMGMFVETMNGQLFRYDNDFPSLKTLIIPQIHPFKLRLDCANNLWSLHSCLWRYSRRKKAYPTLDEWCDVLVRQYRFDGDSKKEYMRHFICPGSGEGKCHYAMNPNCEPDSPPDMVLLFETKYGWNQHGGPELFTFDNHEPKGGCVLLNDGTVKFIRTKEELNKLRWK
jgi:hypothetical protein